MTAKRPQRGRGRRRIRFSAAGRIRLLAAVLSLVLVAVGVRLVMIQGMDSTQLAARALDQRLVEKTLPADRGTIIAADGTLLADNAARFRLVVDQVNIGQYTDDAGELRGAWGAAQDIAAVLDTDPALLLPKLEGEKRWNVVATGLTSEVWREVDALDIPGVTSEEYAIRSYPAGAVGGNLIGFVGSDGQALAGLELGYDDSLRGKDGSQQYERGLGGTIIPLGDNSLDPAVDGSGLQLGIDPTIQLYAQQAIADAVEQREAQWGSIVITDISTGTIITAAEAPSVDPNNPGEVDAEDRGSRIFTASFEPGSTSKMITAAALLDQGLAKPTDHWTVPYEWEAPNGEVFKDSSRHPDQELTLAGILMESSNTGTILAGDQLTEDQRYDYLKRFGFGEPTGIDFPGQSTGILHPAADWDGRTKYTVMFGQGVSATAIQTTEAMATIANGGVHVAPRLVTGTVDPSGRVTPIAPADGERVISEDAARQTMEMLELVTVEGTATKAQIPGYRVAGKTGTAQAPADEGGGYDGYTASFVGAAPADAPRLAVSVTLQRPKKGYYGGEAAAPVFSDVTGFALKHLRVPPSTGKPADIPKEIDQ